MWSRQLLYDTAGGAARDPDLEVRADGAAAAPWPVVPPADDGRRHQEAAGGRMFEMSDKDRRRDQTGSAPAVKRPSALEAGFDRWLDRQLHEIYDPVLDEAIPDEIAGLLARFDRRDGPDDEGGPAAGGGGG